MTNYTPQTTRIDFGSLPFSTVKKQGYFKRTVVLTAAQNPTFLSRRDSSVSNTLIPNLFQAAASSYSYVSVYSTISVEVTFWAQNLPRDNPTGTFTATVEVDLSFYLDFNPSTPVTEEHFNFDVTLTVTDDPPSQDPTVPPPTTTPPSTCTPDPAGCPDGYVEAPVCPPTPGPGDPPPPPPTCTPPVVVPPPGPPTEKTVMAFVTDTDSIALYGPRRGSEYQSDLIETTTQAKRVAEQVIWQSNQVISYQFSTPYNPELRRGQTLRLNSASEGVDIWGIIKDVGHAFDVKTGQVATQVVVRAPEFVMTSQLGETLDYR